MGKYDEFRKMLAKIESDCYKILDNISTFKRSIDECEMNDEYKKHNNEKEFVEYLLDFKLLADSSAKSYLDSLKVTKTMMEEELNINYPCEFIEIDDVAKFEEIVDTFKNNENLVRINLKHHHFHTAALNNYLNFLKGKSSNE